MKIRLYNARILTMEQDFSIQQGELWVEDDRISYIGAEKPASFAWERQIDCNNDLLMPGFKNAHTHSAMTFLRSFADDLPLSEWLHEQVFPMEAQLQEQDIYELSRLAILEYLTSGITANFDMYARPDAIAQASLDTGFRTVLAAPLNDFTSSLAEQEDCYRRYNAKGGRLGYRLGFHAEYTTSETLLKGVAELAQAFHASVWTHSSETAAEVRACIERHGKTPTAYFEQLGLYEYGGGGFHCIHMSAEDLRIFREKGLFVVTNPASNCKLASGIAPLCQMQAQGIRLAIGTDGPASNNCLDMFREMFLVTALQKLQNKDAAAMDAQHVLQMATVGGAQAMELPDCDCLAVGKQADLIRIDLQQPNMQPENHLVKNLVYSGSKQNVRLTMVAGKILYEDGQYFVGENPERIYAYANACIRRMRAGR